MRNINRFTVLGNVGKVTPLNKVTKVNIATNRSYKNDKGNIETTTDWITVTILSEKQAAWVASNVTKGDTVLVEGRISNSSYEKDGAKVYTTDIIATLFERVTDAGDDRDADTGEQRSE